MSIFFLHIFISIILNGLLHVDFDEDKKMTYLALGDSYTIGESVEYKERFPVQLVNKLKLAGFDFAMPEIVAKTGWTTDELIVGIEKADLKASYDLVTLLIGVNNQYRGRDLENYKEEFEQLLRTAISFADENPDKVFVISIPDYGVTPFGQQKGRKKIGRKIDQFNAINLAVAQKYGIAYVDITGISKTAYRRTSLVADDGLHPSGEMYGLWVDQIVPAIIKQITGKE